MELELALKLLQGLPALLELLIALQNFAGNEFDNGFADNTDLELLRVQPQSLPFRSETNQHQAQPPVQPIVSHWPLGLSPAQLTEPSDAIVPLRVLLAPCQLNGICPGMSRHFSTVEPNLAQILADFLSQHYSRHRGERPVEFLSGIWIEQRLQREAQVKALFNQLHHQPFLLLEPEIVDAGFNLRIAWWGFGQKQYGYHTVISQFAHQAVLKAAAKQRAQHWKIIAEQLFAAGEASAQVNQLAEDNALNLQLLEQEAKWQAQGINIQELSLPYQFNHQDFAALAQVVGLMCCVVTAWTADLYHANRAAVAPQLPDLLPQFNSLLPCLDETLVQLLAHTLLAGYRSLLTQVEATINTGYQPHFKEAQARLTLLAQQTQLPFDEIIQAIALPKAQPNLLKPDLAAVTLTASSPEYAATANLPFLSQTLTGYSGQAASLAVSPDSEFLVSGSDDHTVQLWRLPTGTRWRTLAGDAGRILTLTLSQDGQFLGSVHRTSDRSCIQIWDMETGSLCHRLIGHNKAVRCLAISPDNTTLVSGGQKIKVWNIRTGKLQYTLSGHKQAVYALALSPNGQILASSSADKTVRLWHLPSGTPLHTLTGHLDWVRTIAFSPNGELLASGSDDRTIKLWQVETGQLSATLTGHTDAVMTVVFSASRPEPYQPHAASPCSCQTLFSGSKDHSIKLWQLETGHVRQTLTGHQKWISALAVSPDGRLLVSGSNDKTIRIWPAC